MSTSSTDCNDGGGSYPTFYEGLVQTAADVAGVAGAFQQALSGMEGSR